MDICCYRCMMCRFRLCTQFFAYLTLCFIFHGLLLARSLLNLCYVFLLVLFFFFKQKTAYEFRINDWSSDVCSSDLGILIPSSELFNIPTILDILHKKIRERVKVTSPDIRASLKAKGCLSGSLFLASFLIGIECISVFLLLHGFDSHEPIRRVEIDRKSTRLNSSH